MVGDVLDQIATNRDETEWWVTGNGLHIEIVSLLTSVPQLSMLDQVAGPLVIAKWQDSSQRRNIKLSTKALLEIAIELDQSNLRLIEALYPAQRAAFKDHTSVNSPL
jgi:hypothetical protein